MARKKSKELLGSGVDPLLSNRGVEIEFRGTPQNEISKNGVGFDWLNFTFQLGKVLESDIETIASRVTWNGNQIVKPIRPLAHFDHAFQLQAGRVDIKTKTAMEYATFQLKGADLSSIRNHGGIDQLMANQIIVLGGSVSRADIKIDVFGKEDVRPFDLSDAWFAGDYIGHSQFNKAYIDKKKGETVYFGSRKSEIMLRVYDKAIQAKNLGELWKRIEIQAGGDTAKKVIKQASQGMQTLGYWFDRFRFPTVQWWQRETSNLTIVKPQSDELSKEDKTGEWLQKQVIPALKRYRHENPIGFMEFLQSVQNLAENDIVQRAIDDKELFDKVCQISANHADVHQPEWVIDYKRVT